MPEEALYYPEWCISDPVFMAESLLYWDRLACMVPFPEFEERPWHQDEDMRKVLAEAHEFLVYSHVPTDEQKNCTHQKIEAFIHQGPPEWCRPENLRPHHKQVFSAHKFKPETVQMLRDWGWTKQYPRPDGLELQLIADAAADLVIGALADSCSSPTLPPVTDDPGSFSANCNLLLQELGAPTGITMQGGDRGRHQPGIENDLAFLLAKVPHLGLQTNQVSPKVIRRILTARKDSGIEEQRKLFQQKVDGYLERLRTAKDPERSMLAEKFGREIRVDQERLGRELRRLGLEAIFSKEGAVAVLLGLVTGVVNPGLGIAIGLAGGLVSYDRKRQEALDKRWSSWIFSATTNRLTVW